MRDLNALAGQLDSAALNAQAVPQLGELALDEAYEIQSLSLARRYARGERRIGVKMGFTSRAKMIQMGVSDMIWGRLTDRMLVDAGGILSIGKFVHPRVEPEVAFLLKRPLSGRVDPMTAMAAVAGIAPALEIIDSRYENFKFSLTDVVADNSSSSALVIGAWADPHEDFSNLGMVLEIDGGVRQIGSSAGILGNPINSLVAAARLVALRGETLEAGDVVMAGGATAAESLQEGQFIKLQVERLGAVSFSVGPRKRRGLGSGGGPQAHRRLATADFQEAFGVGHRVERGDTHGVRVYGPVNLRLLDERSAIDHDDEGRIQGCGARTIDRLSNRFQPTVASQRVALRQFQDVEPLRPQDIVQGFIVAGGLADDVPTTTLEHLVRHEQPQAVRLVPLRRQQRAMQGCSSMFGG